MKNVLRTSHLKLRWLLVLGVISIAHATTYQIALNTSGLNQADTWYLDYQLVASDLPGENSVTLSSFNFAGGNFTGDEVLSGNVGGSQATQFKLTDPANLSLDNVSELLIAFTPGTQVSFHLNYTNSFSGTGSPDAFFWAVESCDPSSQTCSLPLSAGTTPATIVNPFGASLGASLISTLDGVAADAVPQPFAAQAQFNFIKPTVTPLSEVPEPSSALLLAIAILALSVSGVVGRSPSSAAPASRRATITGYGTAPGSAWSAAVTADRRTAIRHLYTRFGFGAMQGGNFGLVSRLERPSGISVRRMAASDQAGTSSLEQRQSR
jgi:hypothetical protein